VLWIDIVNSGFCTDLSSHNANLRLFVSWLEFCFKRRLYAFDILALDGDDLRKLPLHLRKTNLARLLARRADGIHLDGTDNSRAAGNHKSVGIDAGIRGS
jgi:hypothetical protein